MWHVACTNRDMADLINAQENSPDQRDPAERLADLAGDAVTHAKELVRAELSLAKGELVKELKAGALAVALCVLALVFVHSGYLVLIAAIILALSGKALAAVVVGAALLVLGAGAAFAAYRAFKHRHLPRTRERLAQDAQALLRFRHE